MSVDLENLDLTTLSAEKLEALNQRVIEARVERLIEEQAPLRMEFANLMQRITSAVEPYGLTGQTFLSMTAPQLRRHLVQFLQNQQAQLAHGGLQRRTAKVAPKYRHPDDSTLTWTGRGNKPRWVTEWLGGGRTLEEIAVTE